MCRPGSVTCQAGRFKIYTPHSSEIIRSDPFFVHLAGQHSEDRPIGAQLPDRIAEDFGVNETPIISPAPFGVQTKHKSILQMIENIDQRRPAALPHRVQ